MTDSQKNSNKNSIRGYNLPRRIIILTAMTAIAGIIGIVALLIQLNSVSAQFNQMISKDYANIQFMDDLNQGIYQHQALIYQYISTDDRDTRLSIHNEADNLETQINQILIDFGNNMKGDIYEGNYHSIYSDTIGYFSNIKYVYRFFESGNNNTALYYIDIAMNQCVKSINENISTFSAITQAALDKSQSDLYIRLSLSMVGAILGVIAIIVFALICIGYSAATADKMVSVDSLTGAYNYEKLLRFANRLQKKDKLKEYSLLNFNIKDFKYINQQNGSEVGDSVLKEYSQSILSLLEDNEILSRAGGDNFLLLVKTDNVKALLDRIYEISIELESGQFFHIRSRFGICIISTGDTFENALNNASIAINKAKATSSNIIYFSKNMIKEMVEEKEILTLFEDALQKEEFQVYYQPKVDISSGLLCGCEALVRWIRNGKIVPPIDFIPALENDGSITKLDFYVLEHVCQDINKWQKEGLNPVKVSSNFSKVHLKNKTFGEDLLSILRRQHVKPELIEAELTESSGYENLNSLKSFIARMKEEGVSTSLDDFGIGYSSLSMLQDLDVNTVKLDKSFIDHIDGNGVENEVNHKMIENVINMIKDLNRTVICEGVETKEQADFLLKANCNLVQGYLFDKPLTKSDFEDKLRNPQYNI